MEYEEGMCMRNCFTKLDSTLKAITLRNTRAERILNNNKKYLKKHNPEFKNIDYDPLEKELDNFRGKFYGNSDAPFL